MLEKLQEAEKERDIQRSKEKFSMETMNGIQKKLDEKYKKVEFNQKEKDDEYMKKVEAQENLYVILKRNLELIIVLKPMSKSNGLN